MIVLKAPSIALYLLAFTVGFGFRSLPVSAQTQPAPPQLRDGQHDFDFYFGTWHTHIRRLVRPLTGSNIADAELAGLFVPVTRWSDGTVEEMK